MHIALTGAATGIGAAVAAKCKASGHTVTAYDIVEPPFNIDHWIETDMSSSESVTQAIAASTCLLYTSPSPRDKRQSRMPSSA